MDDTLRLRPVSRAAAALLGAAALVGGAILLSVGLRDTSAPAGWIVFQGGMGLATLAMAWLLLTCAVQGRDPLEARLMPVPYTYSLPVEAVTTSAERIAADQALMAALWGAAATDASSRVFLRRVITARLATLRLIHRRTATLLQEQLNPPADFLAHVRDLERTLAKYEEDLGRLRSDTLLPRRGGAV